MRRRFGRGRRRGGSGPSQNEPIDASHWLGRLAEISRLELAELSAESLEGLPDDYAIVARAERSAVLVGFSPTSGGDATLAALGAALQGDAPIGEILAISPCWSGGDRRRLALLGDLPFPLRPVEVPELGESGGTVRAEPGELSIPLATEQVVARVRPTDRELFRRGLAGLEGLAAKHGGAVRASADGIELVVLAQRTAILAVSGNRLRLETLAPDRSQLELASDSLSTALDRLEGSLRKRLNDRRSRSSQEGLRSDLLSLLGRAVDAVATRPWPVQTHPEREIIDLIGVDAEGRCFVAAAREELGLAALSEVLDATLLLRPLLPLLMGPEVPVSAEAPRILLAAERFDEIALAALSGLACDARLFDVGTRRGEGHTLAPRSPWQRSAQMLTTGAGFALPEVAASSPSEDSEPEPEPERDRAPRRPRRERSGPVAKTSDAAAEESGGIEEISLFDLDDEGRSESDAGRPRRRGRRRGRRGRGRTENGGERSEESAAPGVEASADDEPPPVQEGEARERDSRGRNSRGRGARTRSAEPSIAEESAAADADTGDDLAIADDDDDDFAGLADDAPDLDVPEVPDYEEEEESEPDDDPEADRARRERELRRRARAAKPIEEEPAPRQVRRRAAFVAAADRSSILTALVLARDLRLVEGFWIFPEADLMTFFRSIATDLREDTPIHVVGFTATPPARDTIQAAALYKGRLDWYDHHDWPPEDLLALREALGDDRVHISPGSETSLPAVLSLRTRRSRFSDKLVELITGRFTQHDYERWGRLWWHRIGELAGRPGERRSDIDPLLVGRPSDLAKRAADFAVPEPPPEIDFVAGRDFRLVHFGGSVMVVLEVPPEFDLHLVARVARERYDAQISLAHRPGGELLVLGGDESPGHRGLDLGAMTAHLAAKLEWVEALPDDDHVARMRVHNLWSAEARMDEVVAEIGMGRSIIEG